MISQTASRMTTCDDCGEELASRMIQLIYGDRLRWEIEDVCSACTYHAYICGRDEASEEMREALLSTHGPARLRLHGEPRQPVIVLRVLREMLKLSLSEARQAAQELGRAGLEGTYVEMEFLAQRFRARGVPIIVEHP